jgi:type II secretory pathway component PulF
MDNEQFRQTLQQLHAELHNAKSIDESSRQLMLDLRDDLQQIIDKSYNEEYGDLPGLMKRLENAVERFEISHPKLSAAINNVISTFNNLGI